MAGLKCPTCGRSFNSEDTRALPLCSDRCRQLDLGRWLDEKQSLPHLAAPDEDEKPQGQGESPAD